MIPSSCYFWVIVLLLTFGFQKYLIKPSEYYSKGPVIRPFHDTCVITSAAYLIVAVYLFVEAHSIHLVIINLLCFVSSSLYHLYAEAAFFNMDNIFATTQALIFVWSLTIAYDEQRYGMVAIGVFGIFLSAYLLIICGLPAILDFDRFYPSRCICRRRNYEYVQWHSLWHVVSMGGPLISAYITRSHEGSSCFGSSYDVMITDAVPTLVVPLIPAVALLVSVAINVIGNLNGIMPLK